MKKDYLNSDTNYKKEVFKTPENYFDNVKEQIYAKTINNNNGLVDGRISLWTVIKPQLSLVASFAIIFFIALFVIDTTKNITTIISSSDSSSYNYAVQEGFLNTNFIDFIDQSDTIQFKEEIPQEQLAEYIKDNIDIITIASLE